MRRKPVAAVVSVRELARLRGAGGSFGAAYRSFLKKHALEEAGLDEKHALDEAGLEEGFAASLRAKGSGRSVSL